MGTVQDAKTPHRGGGLIGVETSRGSGEGDPGPSQLPAVSLPVRTSPSWSPAPARALTISASL